MLIFDKDNNLIDNPNFDSGTFEEKQRDVIHRFIVDTPARTHKQVIKVYPNGGKDVKTVVDEEEVSHWETRLPDTGDLIEYEGPFPETGKNGDIVHGVQYYYLYTPYTDEELAEKEKEKETQSINQQIATLKSNLQETDYVATKIAEGVATKEEYADVLAQRAAWRTEINELETQLDSLK